MLNLTAEPGETQGFSAERHVHVLARHAPDLRIDRIVVDAAALPNESERLYVQRAAQALGARAVFADVSIQGDNGQRLTKHDPEKLSSVIVDLYNEYRRT